jgi:hypothetical protein
MFEIIEQIAEEFLALKKESEIEKWEDNSFAFGVLKGKINDAIERAK